MSRGVNFLLVLPLIQVSEPLLKQNRANFSSWGIDLRASVLHSKCKAQENYLLYYQAESSNINFSSKKAKQIEIQKAYNARIFA